MEENNKNINNNDKCGADTEDAAIPESAGIHYMTAEELNISVSEGGFLSLNTHGRQYDRIMIQRAFPLSQPYKYLSVREVKENREPGEEIGIIEDIVALPEGLREIVCSELDMRYFTPDITEILRLKDERGIVTIDAVTTSGKRKITAHSNTSSFIRLSKVRMLIVDVDGNRYNIPDMTRLDKKSRRNLEVIV